MRSFVTKMPPALVAPANPTPSGYLPLSALDRLPYMRSYVDQLQVFDYGRTPAKVISEALAKTLVPYYPVAGRFAVHPEDGKLYIDCTGEGLWFVEASASCRLEDVDFLQCQPLMIPKEQLLPSPPPGVDQDALTFLMQVTEFKCGGFVIGFKSSHCIFDAIGVGQFILAISELSKGLPQPTINPVWHREAIPYPKILGNVTQELKPPAEVANFQLEHCTMDISLESINQIRNGFMEETGKRCSVFDITTAIVWKCRTSAIDPPPSANLHLNFPADIRRELQKEIPPEGGYYGNCVYDIVIRKRSEEIATASLFDVIRLIRSAKECFPTKFAKWMNGDPDEDPLPWSFTYESMSFTDLRLAGFVSPDYGWGKPKHMVPIFDHPIGMCILLDSPSPKKGIRLVTHCVVKKHLQAFKDELTRIGLALSKDTHISVCMQILFLKDATRPGLALL